MRLYSTHCPKCKVLETKLKQKNADCEVVDNLDDVFKFAADNNISSAPILVTDAGDVLDFVAANKFVNGM